MFRAMSFYAELPRKKGRGAIDMTMGMPVPAAVLFGCAAVMVVMAARRWRAGWRGRALLNLVMALFMAIFAWGYLG